MKKMMDQQVRNLRKASAKMIADLNLTMEEQFDMAFMVDILNDDNTISFDENDDGTCTFLQRMHAWVGGGGAELLPRERAGQLP